MLAHFAFGRPVLAAALFAFVVTVGGRSALSQLGLPGVATTAQRVYVANSLYKYDTVTTYTTNGTRTSPTITSGISGPSGVATDAAGKIYVSNFGNDTVTTYLPNGTRTALTIKTPQSPSAIAIGPGGKIYVLTLNSLLTYKADGTRTTPTITTGVISAKGVAVNASGKIYIANYGDGTVKSYTAYGQRTTPTITNSSGYGIIGVAVGPDGKIHLSDASSTSAVRSYASNGSPTTPTIKFNNPQGLAVDAAGKIYVTEYYSGKDSLTTYTPAGAPTSPTVRENGLKLPVAVGVH